jgi:hypothetical protein
MERPRVRRGAHAAVCGGIPHQLLLGNFVIRRERNRTRETQRRFLALSKALLYSGIKTARCITARIAPITAEYRLKTAFLFVRLKRQKQRDTGEPGIAPD